MNDETMEKTSYHIYNADEKQEMEIFKKLFPLDWKERCAKETASAFGRNITKFEDFQL